jgi:hypothetical protein
MGNQILGARRVGEYTRKPGHRNIDLIQTRANYGSELRQKYCYPGGGGKEALRDTLCQKSGYRGQNG